MMLDNVYAFLPTYIKERNENHEWENPGDEITATQTSLILAIFSIAQLIFAPFNAYIKNKIGAKNTIIVGFFLITVTTFGLGVIHYIKNYQVFYFSALALRFFQGQGDVLLQFTGYCIITNVYSDQVMRAISWIEIIVGLGLGVGPLLGSVVYPYLDYAGTMYAFGALNLLTMIYCYCKIPNALNETASDIEVA